MMSKPKLILYSKQIFHCSCYERIFNTEFETDAADREEKFLKKIQGIDADAAVVCFCSAREEDVEELFWLDVLASPLPLLTCSKTLNSEFIRSAAQRGVERFFLCDMEAIVIRDIIFGAIRRGGLRHFLESCYPGTRTSSTYVHKMIDEILHNFPYRLTEHELAQRLGITTRWIQKNCKEAFGRTFTHLMRRIWVYQALSMMQNTNLDNTEIALQLNYTEESNLARDFRKELGYSPTEARNRLTTQSPDDLVG